MLLDPAACQSMYHLALDGVCKMMPCTHIPGPVNLFGGYGCVMTTVACLRTGHITFWELWCTQRCFHKLSWQALFHLLHSLPPCSNCLQVTDQSTVFSNRLMLCAVLVFLCMQVYAECAPDAHRCSTNAEAEKADEDIDPTAGMFN
eukprot:GHUV01028249.1.p1 GENE.GHUV01028249.1~~GHUV01028249.1.p1  ORF type:complete len:146 (-),score=8.98 GHUV01028249.1:153-590(-)